MHEAGKRGKSNKMNNADLQTRVFRRDLICLDELSLLNRNFNYIGW